VTVHHHHYRNYHHHNRSINQSVNQSINQSINQSSIINQSIVIIIVIIIHHHRQHSRFHGALLRGTIRCQSQCSVKNEVERFEMTLDCAKPAGLERTTSWTASVCDESASKCS